jgi:hypothetical protein
MSLVGSKRKRVRWRLKPHVGRASGGEGRLGQTGGRRTSGGTSIRSAAGRSCQSTACSISAGASARTRPAQSRCTWSRISPGTATSARRDGTTCRCSRAGRAREAAGSGHEYWRLTGGSEGSIRENKDLPRRKGIGFPLLMATTPERSIGISAVQDWSYSGRSDSNRRRPAWEFGGRLATACGTRTYNAFCAPKRGLQVGGKSLRTR